MTKTVHKTLPGGGRGGGGQGDMVGVGVGGVLGFSGGVSKCHSIDRMPKLWLLH